MIAFLSILGLVALVLALCHDRRWDYGEAELQYGYGKTHRYRARRDRQTGKVQIFVREWMPATVDESVRVTFIRTDHGH